jgi:hypothetical protein
MFILFTILFPLQTVKLPEFREHPTLLNEAINTIPLIVPIFDGTKALADSTREWIEENFPTLLDGLDPPRETSRDHETDVRIGCSKWFYKVQKKALRTEAPLPTKKNTRAAKAAASRRTGEEKSPELRLKLVTEKVLKTKERIPFEVNDEKNDDDSDDAPVHDEYDPSTAAFLWDFHENEFEKRLRFQENDEEMNFDFENEAFYQIPVPEEEEEEEENPLPSPNNNNTNPKDLMYFYMCPIVKRINHRKHNSHQWFFDAICQGLQDKLHYALLTDCGTGFNNSICLTKLVLELHTMQDLIGVTARQRIEMPNKHFHPCLESFFPFLRGQHTLASEACWKCWVAYFCSPCPLQGAELEGSLALNLSMFNLVEALPVMPGPCQLFDWQKMKKNQVVDEYFNLLFEGENEKKEVPLLHPGLKPMLLPSSLDKDYQMKLERQNLNTLRKQRQIASELEVYTINLSSITASTSSEYDSPPLYSHSHRPVLQENDEKVLISPEITTTEQGFRPKNNYSTATTRTIATTIPTPITIATKKPVAVVLDPMISLPTVQNDFNCRDDFFSPSKEEDEDPNINKTTISFAEFLRVNMRLAEDRILTFVSVFCTGQGTKWVLGSTFYYQPEILWSSLLTQRRRWNNGTFAGFLFYFISPRAKSRIHGGLFDRHKASKSLRAIYGLWSLQVLTLVNVMISPAIFGASIYKSLVFLGDSLWVEAFSWTVKDVYGLPENNTYNIRYAELLTLIYLFIYASWAFYSFRVPRGKVPEALCQLLVFYCCGCVLPIYLSLVRTIILRRLNMIGILVIVNLGFPAVIALGEEMLSAALYILYLPWLLLFIMFFLVFIPTYSFARLWDTTWGNRATGKDSAINDSMENYLKTRNFYFLCLLVILNIALCWAFIQVFSLGTTAVVVAMFVFFLPIVVQLVTSMFFLFVVRPLRHCSCWCWSKGRKGKGNHHDIEKGGVSPPKLLCEDDPRVFTADDYMDLTEIRNASSRAKNDDIAADDVLIKPQLWYSEKVYKNNILLTPSGVAGAVGVVPVRETEEDERSGDRSSSNSSASSSYRKKVNKKTTPKAKVEEELLTSRQGYYFYYTDKQEMVGYSRELMI